MSLSGAVVRMVERVRPPDLIVRRGIAALVGRQARHFSNGRVPSAPATTDRDFAIAMAEHPIAEHTDAANAQHYELPPAFFELVLGPRKKYSSCLFPIGSETLAEAEEFALAETVAHADLKDGQRILELGCGWGSLTRYMAERFPNAQITAVSNSAPQREFIMADARARGLSNITVITANMTGFEPPGTFDRIVSVEMFEHLSNWRPLLVRLREALNPDGRLFIHIFTHRDRPYRFDHTDDADWIGQYFFTGGIMPSHGLMSEFEDVFAVEQSWRWNGQHYRRTAEGWLKNLDAHHDRVLEIFTGVYGRDARLWRYRWRLFFLATAGLFGHGDGEEWAVSHYRLSPR